VARNYAEALFDLGERSGQTDQFARLIDAVAAAVETTPEVQAVLTSPQLNRAVHTGPRPPTCRGTWRSSIRF
jgi:F0F1-type ATP synthase delta subunit